MRPSNGPSHFQPGDPGHPRAARGRVRPRRPATPKPARKKYTFRPTAKPVATDLATGKLSRRPQGVRATHATHARRPGRVVQPRRRARLARRAAEGRRGAAEVDRPGNRRPPGRGSRALVEVLRCGQGMEADADHVARTASSCRSAIRTRSCNCSASGTSRGSSAACRANRKPA